MVVSYFFWDAGEYSLQRLGTGVSEAESWMPLFAKGSLGAGLEPAPNLEQRTGSQPGKLVPQWLQWCADLERITAYIMGWCGGRVIRTKDHKPIMTAVLNNQSELVLTYQNRFHLFEPVLEATLGISMLAYLFLTMLRSWRSDRMTSFYSRKEDVLVEPTLNQR